MSGLYGKGSVSTESKWRERANQYIGTTASSSPEKSKGATPGN